MERGMGGGITRDTYFTLAPFHDHRCLYDIKPETKSAGVLVTISPSRPEEEVRLAPSNIFISSRTIPASEFTWVYFY